jgi:hypothetical protein
MKYCWCCIYPAACVASVIVLDEASASCDPDTDVRIQVLRHPLQVRVGVGAGCVVASRLPLPWFLLPNPFVAQSTIRSLEADVTVLTIAHRLPTIIEYDRVLVMDKV